MSKSMSVRPSQVLSLKDEFVAYAFDSAVIRWGTAFEAALTEAGAGAKTPEEGERRQARAMRRWIPSSRQYASPTKR
jgi:hypothetical protein